MMMAEQSRWFEAVKEAFSPASLLQIAGITYIVAGVGVVIYVFFRYSWPRRQPGDDIPWPRSENPQQGLKLFFMVGGFHPILFFVQIALWPLWLLFLWAHQPDANDDDEEAI
jgi:hypothetical protein